MRRFHRWLNETARVRAACRAPAAAGLRAVTTPDGQTAILTPTNRDALPPAAVEWADAAYSLLDPQERVFKLIEFAVYGRLTRPRCVTPTAAECDALAATDVTLPWGDYTQPGLLVRVALPDGFPAAGSDLPRPGAVLALHDPAARVAAFVLVGDGTPADRALAELPEVLAFTRPPAAGGDAPDPSGREVATHWRWGHWARQPCGAGGRERRLLFRPPVLVRADRLPAAAPALTSS